MKGLIADFTDYADFADFVSESRLYYGLVKRQICHRQKFRHFPAQKVVANSVSADVVEKSSW